MKESREREQIQGNMDEGVQSSAPVKKKFRPGWVVCGLLLSALAAALYMGLYGFFQSVATRNMPGNPLETQEMADMLVRQAYVFYHDLQQMQSPEEISYMELYVQPRPGCGWVLDRTPDGDDLDDETEIPEEQEVSADRWAYSYLQYLEKTYFPELEEEFAQQINYNFNFYCEDLKTGADFSNSDWPIDVADRYFYMTLVFDEYGNCGVADVILGNDPTLMHKYASAAARSVGLETDDVYKDYDGESAALNSYFTLKKPTDCRITYCISRTEWQKFEQGDARLYIDGTYHNFGIDMYYLYRTSGMRGALLFLTALMGVLAVVLPLKIRTRAGSADAPADMPAAEEPAAKILRLPMEALLAMGYIAILGGLTFCLGIVFNTLYGSAFRDLAAYLNRSPQSFGIRMLVYAGNYLLLFLLFLFTWYFGVSLREARRCGVKGYVRKYSLIYRVFPYLRSKVKGLYEALCHFDLTRRSNKLIIRVVVINGVILCLIGSLWLGGWFFAALYSILLYLFLRKYISDLQKKYGLLLKATNEIAEGNLNVQIKEDLGVFEPFKPQVYRIQEGFKRAVEEEVKSQRMKAELITNVSHDLKTPLTAIITYINLLKEENITEEQRREYLDTLERKSLRLKVLIEDLFEVSKANSQNVSLNIMDVDVMSLVKQVAFEMGDKLAERELDLRMVLPEEKMLLPLDSQRTYRIYENLFGNIAKYAMPGTRVYVNGFRVEDTVIITLKNITAEEISVKPEELTERFVRGDASRNTEGSGLGLAIAKSFTELQGGTLDIEVDGDLFKVTTVWKH